MRKGLSLLEVLISTSLMSFILIAFLIIFSGINKESRVAETWSDIISNTSFALDQIKISYLGLEYIFRRNQINELLPRLDRVQLFSDTISPEPIENVDEFRNLTFPNNNVGNAIAFLSFEGTTTVRRSDATRLIIPRYRINIIHLRASTKSFLSWPNIRMIDLVLSQSQFIYSNETLITPITDSTLRRQLQNLIFFDKKEVNDMQRFFKIIDGNGNFINYNGRVNFFTRKVLLKNESYQGIRYSIAYNSSIMGGINIRVPAWAQTNSSRPNFPAGLEVLVIGNKNNRKIYTRICVVGDMSRRMVRYNSSTVTVNLSEKF